jgi:YHS domain-containing protein
MVIEDSKAAARGIYGGETVYFCSAACKKSYDRTHAPSA